MNVLSVGNMEQQLNAAGDIGQVRSVVLDEKDEKDKKDEKDDFITTDVVELCR